MFNENFDGVERPVDTIEFEFRVIHQRNLFDGAQKVIGVEVTCDADVTVLVANNTGWVSYTRFVFEIVEDPASPGLYQIQRQRERKVV